MKCRYHITGEAFPREGEIHTGEEGPSVHFTRRDETGVVTHSLTLYNPEILFEDSVLFVTGFQFKDYSKRDYLLVRVEIQFPPPSPV